MQSAYSGWRQAPEQGSPACRPGWSFQSLHLARDIAPKRQGAIEACFQDRVEAILSRARAATSLKLFVPLHLSSANTALLRRDATKIVMRKSVLWKPRASA